VVLQSLTSELLSSKCRSMSGNEIKSLVHAFISCHLDYCNALLYGISATPVSAEGCCEASHWLAENGAYHADPQVSPLVTDSATGDIQAGNSGAQKCVNGCAPEYLAEFCHPSVDQLPGMRSADSGKLHIQRTQTSFGDRSFSVAGSAVMRSVLRDQRYVYLV